jgi:8-oxo-dGTP diphosphatase
MSTPHTPRVAVDVILEHPDGIVLVERRSPPKGHGLPGGFVEIGETLEQAAAREVREETGYTVRDLRQFRAYSDPARDPRAHTVSVVFSARVEGAPRAGDDALTAAVYSREKLPPLVFDHERILADYYGER